MLTTTTHLHTQLFNNSVIHFPKTWNSHPLALALLLFVLVRVLSISLWRRSAWWSWRSARQRNPLQLHDVSFSQQLIQALDLLRWRHPVFRVLQLLVTIWDLPVVFLLLGLASVGQVFVFLCSLFLFVCFCKLVAFLLILEKWKI